MKTVWVCENRPQVAQKDPKDCGNIRSDGSCTCYGILKREPCDAVEYVPMTALDRLDRLMSEGHYFAYQGGEWHLFRKDGEGCYSGRSPSAIIKMLEAK